MRLKISPGKGSSIPCCYFPTLTLLIDDNARFLRTLSRFLSKEKNTQVFDQPTAVVQFIEHHQRSSQALYAHLALQGSDNNTPSEAVSISISEIHKILLNKNRFDEPGVMVVDYAMPGMTGLEASRKVRNDLSSPIKIILLTGEADERTAVDGFNEGIIDKFIKKSAEDCLEKVKEYIAVLEIKYFQDLSRTILESFKARSNFILEEPEFINLFNEVCEKNKIIEYYLLDESGSFIMLDEAGNIIRLIIKTEEDMVSLYELAVDDKATPKESLKKLADRNGLVYFYNKKSYLSAPKDWRLEDAQSIKGQKNYYYSIIQGTETYPFETKNITPYSQYLKEIKN